MKFEITSPSGKVLEIEGDAPPSEAELDEIFKSVDSGNVEPTSNKKGLDLTPSGLTRNVGNTIGNALASPIISMRDNIPLDQAYQQAQENTQRFNAEEENNPLRKTTDFLTDMAVYSKLPMFNGFKGANALNGLYQGGLIGGLEGLKEGQNPVTSALGGGTTGAILNAALPPALQKASAGIQAIKQNAVKSPIYKATLGNLADTFANVPKEIFNKAYDDAINNGGELLRAEVGANPYQKGTELFRGALNKAKKEIGRYADAFRGLGENAYDKLSKMASDKIPNNEETLRLLQQERNNLGQQFLKGLDNLEQKLQADVFANKLDLQKIQGQETPLQEVRQIIDDAFFPYQFGRETSIDEKVYNNALNELEKYKQTNSVTPFELQGLKQKYQNFINWEKNNKDVNNFYKKIYMGLQNRIANISPKMGLANNNYAKLQDLLNATGGVNDSTIAKKLTSLDAYNNLLNGTQSPAFQQLDAMLENPVLSRFNELNNMEKQLLANADKSMAESNALNKLANTLNGNMKRYEGMTPYDQSQLDKLIPNEVSIYNNLKAGLEKETNAIKPLDRAILQKNAQPLVDPHKMPNDLEQMAIQDLQDRTGINFIDELNNAKVQDIMNRDIYSAGGGYGSIQGKKNLLADQLSNVVPAPIRTIAKYQLQRPSFYKQQLLKASDLLNKPAKQFKDLPESVKRLLNIGVGMGAPILYGGISNDDMPY